MARLLHRLVWPCWLLFSTLLMAELVLRGASQRKDHVERLFGKPWYFLVPFDLPTALPPLTTQEGQYRIYDPDLGWSHGPGGMDPPLYFADRDGVRVAQVERDGHALADQPDIICLGDSFTHGDEVEFAATWPHRLALRSGRRVVNLGVGGYGIDQAALRYELSKAAGRLVLLGLISGDFERALTPIYNFRGGGLKTKPMFIEGPDGLQVANRPALAGPELGRELSRGVESALLQLDREFDPRLLERSPWDRLYFLRLLRSIPVWRASRRPPVYLRADRDLEFGLQILRSLDRLAHDRGARLVVVLLDNGPSLADRNQVADPWLHVRRGLGNAAIAMIDATAPIRQDFDRDPASVINPGGVHYTPAANDRVAELLSAELHARGF